MLSFRNRLLILLIGLVVGAETVTLFTALASTRTTVRQDAADQLRAGAVFAQQQLEFRGRLLTGAATALTYDFDFRTLMAGGDQATLASNLTSLSMRAGTQADLTLALDPDGKLIAQGEGTAAVTPELIAAVAAGQASDTKGAQFVVTPTGVYQVVTAPVLAPDEIGRIALGYAVDTKLAQDLSDQVGVAVAFLSGTGDAQRIVASTLAALPEGRSTGQVHLGDAPTYIDARGEEYLAAVSHPPTRGASLELALLKPMYDVMLPYRQLALNLGLIIGATLAAAVVAGIYLGRVAARPVQQLAAGAARIATGDYSQAVVGSGGQELEHLAQAFNSMQAGIADRESRMLHMARHDAATGLPNRVFAEDWLDARVQALGRGERIGVVLLAVTNLQEISASLGFEITEQLVLHLARSLEHWSEQGGLVARVDAAHFVVATTLVTDNDKAAFVARVRDHSQAPLATAGITLQAVTVLGAVVASRHGGNAAELLRCAEAAVETAIQQRQPFAFFERASDEAQRRRLKLGADLPQALLSGQLHMEYQPKFRMSDRSPRGVEALVRWQHPEFGKVSPAEFVPIAERTGASGLLTRWVLRETLSQLAVWQQQGIHIELAVNLSAADIVDPGMLEFILGALRDSKLAASSLTLEITESVLLHEPEVARRNMEMLRVAGVRFSIDDFGTGYSSLSQLRELPADELKIDQSFVRVLTQGAEHVAVIRAIVELAHGLGLRTVAEGVEEEAQWRLLAELGCDYVQGYLVGRPQLMEQLTPRLQAALANGPGAEARTASLRVLELRRRE